MTKEEIYEEIEKVFSNEGIDAYIENDCIKSDGMFINFADLNYIYIDSGVGSFSLSLDSIEKLVKLLRELKKLKEKRYLIKLLPLDNNYLNSDLQGDLFLSTKEQGFHCQTQFTEKEYNELAKRYPEYLPPFDENDKRFIEIEGDED